MIVLSLIVSSLTKQHDQSAVSGKGIRLESDCWKTNELGFQYYDKEGYQNSFGIDVSEWVEDIDFRALKKSGVEFVIFRVGYRGYETGKFVLDNNLSTYLKNAWRAGLKMGAYFVSQAINEEEAREEAKYVIEHVENYPMVMPLYIDLETVYDDDEIVRTSGLSKEMRTRIAEAFCREIESAGYRAGVYANEVWFTDKLNFPKIRQYDIWLAKYSDSLVTDLPINMWQFSSEGLVAGCDMWVDLNVRVTKE